MKGISERSLKALPSIDHWEPDILTMYTGSDRKEGMISPDGERYLIKYPGGHARINDMDTSYVNNILSEYISSHVLQIAGSPVHETFIGLRDGEPVVACKNFLDEQEVLTEFGNYMRKHYNSNEINRVPDIAQIRYVLDNDPVLRPHAGQFWGLYWERFVADALTGNFDRHMGNWGYIIDRQTKDITGSPIYDNGSTLYPALSEEGMREIMGSPKEIAKRILLFPKAALTVKGQKVSYLDMLSSDHVPELSEKVRQVVPQIQRSMPAIHQSITGIGFLSETRKTFYITMLRARMDLILAPAYRHCLERKYDSSAYERLANGIDYDEKLFERYWDTHGHKIKEQLQNIQSDNQRSIDAFDL